MASANFIANNRLWNLKVSAAQTKLVELEVLCSFLGVNTVKLAGEEREFSVREIVFDMFVRLRGRRKA